MSIAINPGNSGGPVFDPAGRVIGVATLKSSKAEALAFCIPVEEVNAGLARLDSQPATAASAMASRHQSQLAFQMLTTAGVLYSIGLEARAGVLRTIRAVNGSINLLPSEELKKFNEVLSQLDEKQFSLADGHVAELSQDPALPQVVRREYQDLAANYKAMKDLYAHPSLPADQYASRVQKLKAQHLRLVKAMSANLKAEVPPKLLAILDSRPMVGQPTMAVVEFVPSPVQSRMLRNRPGVNPRGPNGQPLSPAQGRPPAGAGPPRPRQGPAVSANEAGRSSAQGREEPEVVEARNLPGRVNRHPGSGSAGACHRTPCSVRNPDTNVPCGSAVRYSPRIPSIPGPGSRLRCHAPPNFPATGHRPDGPPRGHPARDRPATRPADQHGP